MRKDLTTSLLAIVVLTVLLGLAYRTGVPWNESGWSNRQPAFYPKWVEKVEPNAVRN